MQARDVMSDGVVSISKDATVLEAATRFLNCHVSAMPVTDDSGTMIGIVSEADLIRPPPGDLAHLLARIADSPDAAARIMRSTDRTLADVMTQDVVVASEDTPLAELARLMTDNAVKRLPIVRDGKVVGIVSRIDLLRALVALNADDEKSGARYSRDQQLRQEIAALCAGRAWSQASRLDVVVHRGVAHLWGTAPSEMVRKAYQSAAQSVPGVKAVELHMHVIHQATATA
jgi:CBS domain-containing protein